MASPWAVSGERRHRETALLVHSIQHQVRISRAIRSNLESTRVELEEALRQLRRRTESLSGSLQPPTSSPADPDEARMLAELTPREHDVLRLIGKGLRTKAIALQLSITFKTVVCHKSHIMDKLGMHSVVDLARFAIRNGVCRP